MPRLSSVVGLRLGSATHVDRDLSALEAKWHLPTYHFMVALH